ncbi:MAG: hypothetical protein ACK5O2_00825 [Microthrixaceae bacterium]
MTTLTDRAAQVAALIRAVLPAEQIVTHDPAVIDRRGAGPQGAVLVHPAPDIDYRAGGVTVYEWTLFVLARPGRALDALDSIGHTLDALTAAGIGVDRATPGSYAPTSEQYTDLPGYLLTITDEHLAL